MINWHSEYDKNFFPVFISSLWLEQKDGGMALLNVGEVGEEGEEGDTVAG